VSPNTFPDCSAHWVQMQVRGTLATRAYGAEPDIAARANGYALNPARIEPSQRGESMVQAAAARLTGIADPGLTRMAELAHEALAIADEAWTLET
jgi:hypothetical protein